MIDPSSPLLASSPPPGCRMSFGPSVLLCSPFPNQRQSCKARLPPKRHGRGKAGATHHLPTPPSQQISTPSRPRRAAPNPARPDEAHRLNSPSINSDPNTTPPHLSPTSPHRIAGHCQGSPAGRQAPRRTATHEGNARYKAHTQLVSSQEIAGSCKEASAHWYERLKRLVTDKTKRRHSRGWECIGWVVRARRMRRSDTIVPSSKQPPQWSNYSNPYLHCPLDCLGSH